MAYPLENLQSSFFPSRLTKGNKKYPVEYHNLRKEYHALSNKQGLRYHYITSNNEIETVGRRDIGYVIQNNYDGNKFVIYFGISYPDVEFNRINNELAMQGIRPFIYEVGRVNDEYGKQDVDEEGRPMWYWVTDYFEKDELIDSLCRRDSSMLGAVYNALSRVLDTIHKSNYVIRRFKMKQMFVGSCSNYNNNNEKTIFCNCGITRWFKYPSERFEKGQTIIDNPSVNDVTDYLLNNIVKIDFSRYNSVRTDETGFVEPIDNWMSLMFIMLDVMGMFIPDCIIFDNDYTYSRFDINNHSVSYNEAKKDFDSTYTGTVEMYQYYLNKYLHTYEIPATNFNLNMKYQNYEQMFENRIQNKIDNMKKWKRNFVEYINWMMLNKDMNIKPVDIKNNTEELMLYLREEYNVFAVDGVQWNYYNLFILCIAYLSMIKQFKTNYVDNTFMHYIVPYWITFFTNVYIAYSYFYDEEWFKMVKELNPNDNIPEDYDEFLEYFTHNNVLYPSNITINPVDIGEYDSYDRFMKYTCINDYTYPIVTKSDKLTKIMNNVTGVSVDTYEVENETPNQYLRNMNMLAAKIAEQDDDNADPRYYSVSVTKDTISKINNSLNNIDKNAFNTTLIDSDNIDMTDNGFEQIPSFNKYTKRNDTYSKRDNTTYTKRNTYNRYRKY